MTTTEQDRETIISIVREMAESMTGAQSTRHWAPDVLWFDIPPFASRGVSPARKLFDDTFANFESCKVDILELDATVNGDMGIVCSVQSTNIVLKNGATKHVMARQTDCFERRANGLGTDPSTRVHPGGRRVGRQDHDGVSPPTTRRWRTQLPIGRVEAAKLRPECVFLQRGREIARASPKSRTEMARAHRR